MLYFAYGMNLDPFNMYDTQEVGPGVLHDWELVFRGHANIERKKHAIVPGALWEVDDLGWLDRREGYPIYYDRAEVEVQGPDGLVQAVTYFMADHTTLPIMSPGDYYLAMLVAGYEHFGLPKEVLNDATHIALRNDKRRTGAGSAAP